MAEVLKVDKVDEVYFKITCEPSISYELQSYFTFDVPGVKFMPAYRNKFWDGKIRIFHLLTGRLYVGLIFALEKFCQERNYELQYNFDSSAEEFSVKEADDFIETLNLPHKVRDYQTNAFVHCIRNRRALLVSPTASGKSLIIYLLQRYYDRRTLVIVPTTSLVHQLLSDFNSYGLDTERYCHTVYSGQEKISNKQIIITTWQSVFKLPKEYFSEFECVIGDEAHLFKAKSLTAIMTKLVNTKYRFGFTGTLDGTLTHQFVLEGLFGKVEKAVSTSDLIEQQHLASFEIKAIILKYSDEIKKIVSKFDYQQEMDFLVRFEARNNFIKNLALSLKGNTLLLFQYVDKHGKVLYDIIQSEAKGRKVFYVSGEVDGQEREKIRGIVETQRDSIIVASYGTFSTGINIRNLHNIIFASPSKSRIRNLQSIGRGLRKSDSKEHCTLFDIADDLQWKNKRNFTINHFVERIKIYAEEKFDYKIYKVNLKDKNDQKKLQ